MRRSLNGIQHRPVEMAIWDAPFSQISSQNWFVLGTRSQAMLEDKTTASTSPNNKIVLCHAIAHFCACTFLECLLPTAVPKAPLCSRSWMTEAEKKGMSPNQCQFNCTLLLIHSGETDIKRQRRVYFSTLVLSIGPHKLQG